MRFGSLFSGVGGLDRGLELAGMECAWQVEIDDYCNKVLEKHWPSVPRFSDVREAGKHNLPAVDLVAGGFPCQDVSDAGRRAGIEGSRSGLWFEFARIIRELRPKYVLVENVTGLLVRGLGRVLGDLAAGGYDAEWQSIPAAYFGAHHLRYRVFIVATDSNTNGERLFWRSDAPQKGPWSKEQFERLLGTETQMAIPAGSLGGISDGLSHRVDRLKGLGNAVVPQVAEWVGRRIMENHNTPSL